MIPWKGIIWTIFGIMVCSIILGFFVGVLVGGFASTIQYQTTISFIDHYNLTSQLYDYVRNLDNIVAADINNVTVGDVK